MRVFTLGERLRVWRARCGMADDDDLVAVAVLTFKGKAVVIC